MIEVLQSTGLAHLAWRELVMLGVAGLLMWLAIARRFEPLLLVPIGFGALLANLPLAELMRPATAAENGGLFWYLFFGVKLEIFPPLIFLGLGALTDFGPLLANPKTLFLGAAAQFGVFATFLIASALGFSPEEAASIGIIGGADGPTSIYLSSKLAPHLPQMEANLARVLGVEVEAVNVKATTEEGLCVTGAGEAILAHAVVLLE